MARRLFDMVCAAVALVILSPLLVGAWLGVRLVSPGAPPLFRTRRVGLRGRPFTMYKLRTMHGSDAPAGGGGSGPRITGVADARVFPLGRLLRKTKIDELPQLWNIIRGDMAIVGPRPEDPEIVRRHYAPVDYVTLVVRPGLASPGSLYQYAHGDALLAGGDPERNYVEQLLPIKLTLDRVYVRRASWHYDLAIIARTVRMILFITLGVRRLPEPPELAEARRLLPERSRSTHRRASSGAPAGWPGHRVEPPIAERA